MVTVCALPGEERLAGRLRDLGMTEGTRVKCLGAGPLGDPAAYLIRGAVVAIRKKDAARIETQSECGLRIAFAGNPNVGKSTLFNRFTGMRQHTGNWPGKTVDLAEGRCVHGGRVYILTDLPGCYSLSGRTAEEAAAEEYLRSGEADAVVAVCDATCLERNLYLVLQILEITDQVVVCVNLMDEAARKRIRIDLPGLERRLGVPVVGCVARRRGEQDKIFTALERLRETAGAETPNTDTPNTDTPNTDTPDAGAECEKRFCGIGLADGESAAGCGENCICRAEEICREVVSCRSADAGARDRRWDRLFTGKYTAVPMMFLFLLGIFWLTMTGANYPSKLLGGILFSAEGELADLCRMLGMPEILYQPLIFGMYRVLAWVVSVMLPPMAVFFPLFTLLEDLGYLPRIAFNMDRCFQKCRACGKQALTMCMGFGCNAVGVTGCRIIDSPRERLIAVLTNSFVPCNGRFPMLTVLISMFLAGGRAAEGLRASLMLAGMILFGILMTFLVSRLLSATVLRGMPSSFIMELPPYRRPQFGKVVVRSVLDRTVFVLGRAVAVAAPAGLVIWLLANLTVGDKAVLYYCTDFLDPVGRMMGMDGVILMAFILGFPANEIVLPIMVMTYMSQGTLTEFADAAALKSLLVQNGWTWVTALCTALFSLMHWPCSTTLLTIRKETGSLRWCAAAFYIPTAAGALICCLVHALAG